MASVGSSGLRRQEISYENERGPLTVEMTVAAGTGERVGRRVGRNKGVPEGVTVAASVG